MSSEQGIVYLVGAGPGDPGLITRRGAAVLALADVVVYDHLASLRLLDLAPARAIRICAGKSVGHCTMAQEAINELLVEHARAGRRVVRLKGGDPYVFGRGAEEAEHLRASGLRFEVVPGVTAGVGVTAYAGLPVTHREVASAVAFVTGHGDPEAAHTNNALDWEALARFPGTLVIYMGVTRLAALCRTLIRLGKPALTPAAVVEAGTTAKQRIVAGTLASLPALAIDSGIGPPALLVVGEVVSRRAALRWFEDLPLFGQRIVVTRPVDESDRSASLLEALGAEVLLAPMVEIGPPLDYSSLDGALERLDTFDWLVFTSSNGVRHFFERLQSRGSDLRAVGHLRLATIGPGTADALAAFHLKSDLIPSSYRSESLADDLAKRAAGCRILLARADRGRRVLLDELQRVAEVEQVAVYRNSDAKELPQGVLERITEGSVDWITLTSSAITERLHALLPADVRSRVGSQIRLASLSPVTTAAAANLGWEVATEAAVYTWDGLVKAIVGQQTAAARRDQSQSGQGG